MTDTRAALPPAERLREEASEIVSYVRGEQVDEATARAGAALALETLADILDELTPERVER